MIPTLEEKLHVKFVWNEKRRFMSEEVQRSDMEIHAELITNPEKFIAYIFFSSYYTVNGLFFKNTEFELVATRRMKHFFERYNNDARIRDFKISLFITLIVNNYIDVSVPNSDKFMYYLQFSSALYKILYTEMQPMNTEEIRKAIDDLLDAESFIGEDRFLFALYFIFKGYKRANVNDIPFPKKIYDLSKDEMFLYQCKKFFSVDEKEKMNYLSFHGTADFSSSSDEFIPENIKIIFLHKFGIKMSYVLGFIFNCGLYPNFVEDLEAEYKIRPKKSKVEFEILSNALAFIFTIAKFIYPIQPRVQKDFDPKEDEIKKNEEFSNITSPKLDLKIQFVSAYYEFFRYEMNNQSIYTEGIYKLNTYKDILAQCKNFLHESVFDHFEKLHNPVKNRYIKSVKESILEKRDNVFTLHDKLIFQSYINEYIDNPETFNKGLTVFDLFKKKESMQIRLVKGPAKIKHFKVILDFFDHNEVMHTGVLQAPIVPITYNLKTLKEMLSDNICSGAIRLARAFGKTETKFDTVISECCTDSQIYYISLFCTGDSDSESWREPDQIKKLEEERKSYVKNVNRFIKGKIPSSETSSTSSSSSLSFETSSTSPEPSFSSSSSFETSSSSPVKTNSILGLEHDRPESELMHVSKRPRYYFL
jgi:hypothetical protein